MNSVAIKLLAERFLKKDNISDWAVKCIEEGFDSYSLRILASTSTFDSPFQTDNYFERTLRELGWETIREQDYLMKYTKVLALEIVKDKIDPIKASRDIYQILIELDYPSELSGWHEIDEMIWDYEQFVKTGEKYYFFQPKEKLISEIKRVSEELIKLEE